MSILSFIDGSRIKSLDVSSAGVGDTVYDLGKIPPDKTTDCITMMIEVDGHEVEAVLDTGSGMTIMSNEFLETTLEAIIQESSNVDLIDVNRRKKRVLGKVTNVPITVQGERLVNLDIQVTEVTNYKIILGNDWLVKVKSEINLQKKSLHYVHTESYKTTQ